MGTRKILTAAIVALVLLSWGLVAAPSAGQNAAQAPAAAAPGPILLRNCQTYWEDERIISSKIQGRIAQRLVNDGDPVKEGQELAKLDDREAWLEFSRQDKLGKSDLNEQKEYKRLEEYSARLDSAGRLVRIQAIPVEEWRMAKVNVEFSELTARKEAETREIEQIKAEQTEMILKEHVIKSPIRGIIKKCFKRPMELVTPSDHQMFHIVATDKLWVEGWAPVSDVYRIRLGQEVNVNLTLLEPEKSPLGGFEERDTKPSISPGLPAPTPKPIPEGERPREPQVTLPQERINFTGSIVFIDPNVDPNYRAFRVRAEVENQYEDPDKKLPIMKAGMKAKMAIDLNKAPAAKGDEPKN